MADYTLKHSGSEIDDAIDKVKAGGVVPTPSGSNLQLVTDGEGVTKWIPRLVYDEVVEILPTSNLGEPMTSDSSYSWLVMSESFTLTEGETYLVHYNGAEYYCTGKAYSMTDTEGTTYQRVCLGEMSGLGDYESTGEPFRVMYDMTQDVRMFYTFDGATDVTLSIDELQPKKIDAKYIPGYTLPKLNTSDMRVCVWSGYAWGGVPLDLFKAMLENVT